MKGPINFKWLTTISLVCIVTFTVNAQFTVRAAFNSDDQGGDIIIGGPGGTEGAAYLTSGIDDPVNSGWLRLTTSETYQKGYAYINRTFPSTLGVLVDFEYKMWRDHDPTGGGGDGFSVFLFDGTIGPEDEVPEDKVFRLGGYGGSLGYAPNSNAGVLEGLKGGYIGIGFDAHGNFTNISEGRNGGREGKRPNAIVLRGPTTMNTLTTNAFLDGVTLRNDSIMSIDSIGNKIQNEIHYNNVSTIRPNDASFYRRVQIEIIPFEGQYKIIVRWKKEITGEFIELFEKVTNEKPPETLKLGFAASSGSAVNYHEIRSLLGTTPGNLRVTEMGQPDILRANVDGQKEFSYIMEVNNDTEATLKNIQVKNSFMDGNGNPVPEGMVEINGIKVLSTGSSVESSFPAADKNPITSGVFMGTLGLNAKTETKIEITGVLNEIPEGNLLVSTAYVESTDITDEDMENNTSFVKTPVYAEGVDLVVQNNPSSYCWEPSGNQFSLTVSNLGGEEATYTAEKSKITVTNTFPEGVTLQNINTEEWSYKVDEKNTYIFTKLGTGILYPGASLPPITYTASSNEVFTNSAQVSLEVESEEIYNIELDTNLGNNTGSAVLQNKPEIPITTSRIYYCQGETAVQLQAEVSLDSGYNLLWYTDRNGVALNNAPRPNTSNPGTYTYYVSQTNGNCESEMAEIKVIVLGKPEPGTISTAEVDICEGTTPEIIQSVTSHTISENSLKTAEISFQWERSYDGGVTWEEIDGATTADYQPGELHHEVQFQRITYASIGGQEGVTCVSVPTEPVKFTLNFCDTFINPFLPSRTTG